MRYIIGFLIVVGLIVLVFVLVLKSFGGGSKPTTTPLVNYANTNTVVQMTIDGPINADQQHYELQMTIGNTQSQLNLQQGYEGTTVNSKTYANNTASYAEFLRALDLAGYSKGATGQGVDSDPRGYCPTGERYTFKISNAGNNIENFWATSCGGQGTFKGSATIVKNLFIAQMPDYQAIVNGTDLF